MISPMFLAHIKRPSSGRVVHSLLLVALVAASNPCRAAPLRTLLSDVAETAAVGGDDQSIGGATLTIDNSALTNNTINITRGGTYSGNWVSTNSNVAAVTISTDDPVTIQNSTVTGRGHLIAVTGRTGANLIVRNVTGQALDPLVSGKARGAFVVAYIMNSLVVQNCTISGASFGVKSAFSNLSTLSITNNVGIDLEDRASDGAGGFLKSRPQLGHFILMHQDSAPGGQVAWNKLTQTIGTTSTEDVINLFQSGGTAGAPLKIHDNYMEGYSSLPTTHTYTGNGIITDGDATGGGGYVKITDNQMVHTAGGGVAIASGHDVIATFNRVVSCGMDATGGWYTDPHVSGVYVGNYYHAAIFANNSVTNTSGGLVAPNSSGQPRAVDVADTVLGGTNSVTPNKFTDPCLVSASINLAAEDAERAYWKSKLAVNGETLGDQH